LKIVSIPFSHQLYNSLVSLRSKTTVDVGAIANELGGGGHKHASGYSSTFDLGKTIAQLIESLDAMSVR